MSDAVFPEYVIRQKEGDDRQLSSFEARDARFNFERPKKLTNKSLAVAQRRMRMAAMCADGMTFKAIAEELGLHVITVGDEIKKLVEDLEKQALDSMGRKIAREVAVLNMVQLEATIAWYESKEGKVTHLERKSRELRAAFIKGTSKRRVNVAKPPRGMSPLDVQQKTRSRLRDLFADSPEPVFPDPDSDRGGAQGEAQFGENVVQLPIERSEEYTRTEYSSGAAEFLRIILDCHDKRCKLLGLGKQEDGGYDAYTALTPDQRQNRLSALVQDLRAAKAIAEGAKQLEADNGYGTPVESEPIEAHAENVREVVASPRQYVVAVPVHHNGNSGNGSSDEGGGPQ